MAKTRKLGSNIPSNALEFEAKGVRYRRGETKNVKGIFICQIKNLDTGKWMNDEPFSKIEKYLKY
jgi:hypothetical protein